MAAVSCFTPSSHVRDHVSVVKHSEGFRTNKRGRVKSVTWAARDQICQVRLFLSDDCPAMLGPIEHELIQSNGPRKVVPGHNYHNQILGIDPRSHVKRARMDSKSNMSVQVAWTQPPKFLLNASLFVASGEESSELALQQKRELSVLEAFYPRLTSIPQCPLECQDSCENESGFHIPEVPLTPSDDDVMLSATTGTDGSVLGRNNNVTSAPQVAADVKHEIVQPNISGDIATAVCMAINELGAKDLVDQQLLLEILRNPSLMKLLSSSNQLCFKDPSLMTHGNIPVDKSPCQKSEEKHPYLEQSMSDVPSIVRPTSFHVENAFHVSSSMQPLSSLNANGNEIESCCQSSILSPHFVPRVANGVYYQSEIREMAPQQVIRGYSDSKTHTSQCVSVFAPAYQRAGQSSGVCESDASNGTTLAQTCWDGVWQPKFSPRENSKDLPLAQTCRDAAKQVNGIRGGAGSIGNPLRKPCIYFNTARGCRNGEKCVFRH